MRLIACPDCHTQYDVTGHSAPQIVCRCGRQLENRVRPAVEALIQRCGACGAMVGERDEACAYCGSAIERRDESLNLICPECYARCPGRARFCTACGVPFRPEAPQVEVEELPCPACEVLMPAHRIGEIGLNECPQCHGLWVPEDRFATLVDRALQQRRVAEAPALGPEPPRISGDNPARQQVRYLKCPVCMAFMQRSNFRKTSGVIVDQCLDHGTWLDSDELERIAGFLLSAGEREAEPNREFQRAQRKAALVHVRLQHEMARHEAKLEQKTSLLDTLLRLLQ